MLQRKRLLKSVCLFFQLPHSEHDAPFSRVTAYVSDGNTTPNHGDVSAMPYPLLPKANKRLSGIDTWHEKRCDFQLPWPHQSRYYH